MVTLTAAIAHGFCCNLFLADEGERHGAAAFVDVLIHTLDEVFRACREKNFAFPEHLVLQSDNTVSQAKNNLVMLFLAYLVGSGRFVTTMINFLMVGHTHEDVDQVFGIVCEVLKTSGGWGSPEELASILLRGLGPKFQARGERLNAWRHSNLREPPG